MYERDPQSNNINPTYVVVQVWPEKNSANNINFEEKFKVSFNGVHAMHINNNTQFIHDKFFSVDKFLH